MEVPQGNAPPESSPEVTEIKNTKPTNSKRNFFVFMALCGLLLTGVLVALVPDWDDNEEGKQKELKPFFKVFDPSLPIFNGTHTRLYHSLLWKKQELIPFCFVSYIALTNSFSLSIHLSIYPSTYI
jgi:hypothetical protein